MKVIDANIGVKWEIPESDSAKAIALQSEELDIRLVNSVRHHFPFVTPLT